MVKSMKPGSIVVDLAVEQGGNCELSEYDQVVEKHGVTIVGYANWPSRVAVSASSLYARNLFNFLQLMVDKESKQLKVNMEDQLIAGTRLTQDGEVIHERVKDIVPPKGKGGPSGKDGGGDSGGSTGGWQGIRVQGVGYQGVARKPPARRQQGVRQQGVSRARPASPAAAPPTAPAAALRGRRAKSWQTPHRRCSRRPSACASWPISCRQGDELAAQAGDLPARAGEAAQQASEPAAATTSCSA